MATHSSTLAWKIPRPEDPGRLQSMGSLRVDTTEQLPFHFSLSCIGEGNGNPLQCSCLENTGDWRAWWPAVSGVAQSRTRLKWLSSMWLWSTLGYMIEDSNINAKSLIFHSHFNHGAYLGLLTCQILACIFISKNTAFHFLVGLYKQKLVQRGKTMYQ